MEEEYETIEVKLSDETMEKLHVLALETGISMEDLVANIIKEELEKPNIMF